MYWKCTLWKGPSRTPADGDSGLTSWLPEDGIGDLWGCLSVIALEVQRHFTSNTPLLKVENVSEPLSESHPP